METKSSLKSLESSNSFISPKYDALAKGLLDIESVYGPERYRFYRSEIFLGSCDIYCLGLICGHEHITSVVFEDLDLLSKGLDLEFDVFYRNGKLFVEFQFIVYS